MSDVLDDLDAAVDRAIDTVGERLLVMAPLGLGKPVQLLNAFYARALADRNIELHIYTALCLERPVADTEIEASLSDPIVERLFGDYEELAFMQPLREGRLPDNVQITEVYFKAGAMTDVVAAQRNYISSNYTHIARDLFNAGANVLLQLVATRESAAGTELSLSCNTDLSLELMQRVEQSQRPFIAIAQAHPDLPFMEHDAIVAPDFFDLLVQNPAWDKSLFAVPNAAVPARDYATALHASSLIADGGTLQIGIGALGDALAHACVLRQHHNADYCDLLHSLAHRGGGQPLHCERFETGLYASTEMFVNGILQLIEQGVIKRRVYDQLTIQGGLNSGAIGEIVDQRLLQYGRERGLIPSSLDAASLRQLQYWGILPAEVELSGVELRLGGQLLPNNMDDPATRRAILLATAGGALRNGRLLHAGFFLGPRDFYKKLHALDAAGQEAICMTGVSRTNQLLLDRDLYTAQRQRARFINTGMLVTLTGAVASDALEDGTVISGVGGQYNFVAMAHDLPGARSILCIRSTRGSGRHLQSNIVPSYGHITIPKHLRDVIVTEYGIADLRGQSDSEVIRRLINIADSRFQDDLLEYARQSGKLPADYKIPQWAGRNTPERLQQSMAPAQKKGLLPDYPFGTELTEREITLAASLRNIKALSDDPAGFAGATLRALLHRGDPEAARPFLQRLQLEHPDTPREFIVQQLLLLDLEERGLLKAS